MNVKRFFSEHWLALVIIAAYLIFAAVQFSKFQHLPGPIYGGDLYSHYGYTQNFINNGLWSDPYYVGETIYYPWLGHVFIIIFKFLTGMSLMKAMIYFPLIIIILSYLSYYFLGIEIFGKKGYANIFAVLNQVYWGIPDAHPNLFGQLITIPLVLLFLLRYEKEYKTRDMVFLGISLGLVGLAHIAKFIGIIIMLCIFALWKLYKQRNFVQILKRYIPVAFIGFLVASPFYLPLVFTYHGVTKNPVFQYNIPPIENLGIGWMSKILVNNTFGDFKTIFHIAAGVLTILGFIIFFLKRKEWSKQIVLVWFVGGFLAPLHHYITNPLLDRWVLPYHMIAIWIGLIAFLVMGIHEVNAHISRRLKVPLSNYVQIIFVLLLLIPMANSRINDYNNDQWVNYGRQMDSQTKALLDSGDWIKQNTGINDVFLAFDESSFAIEAVSARKLMIVRRTHANYFVDIDKRIADAVVAMYGNDSNKTKMILSEYNVGYFLLDPYLLSSYMKIRPEFEKYLADYGVKFTKGRDRLDPSNAEAVQYDLLLIPAQPLGSGFTDLLEPLKEFKANGQDYIKIYRVRTKNAQA